MRMAVIGDSGRATMLKRLLMALTVVVLVGFAAAGYAQDEAQSPDQPAAMGQPSAPQQQAQNTGKQDFMKYCARCHGANGEGHGPDLYILAGVHPANLTLLTSKNGGVFPYKKVEDFIDGRKTTPSHHRFDMAFWGVQFQEPGKEFTPQSEAVVKARIDRIVEYIKTIQRK